MVVLSDESMVEKLDLILVVLKVPQSVDEKVDMTVSTMGYDTVSEWVASMVL